MPKKKESGNPPDTTVEAAQTPEMMEQEEPATEEAANVREGQTDSSGELAALQDKYLRLAAEYDNYRRRTMQEKQDTYENAKADTVALYLPLYDNLCRAANAPCTDESYAKGVQMLVTQSVEIMGKLGVTEIPALGESFDPNIHNAISHVEDESLGENEVVEVFAPGFRSDKRVVRPSMVKVAN